MFLPDLQKLRPSDSPPVSGVQKIPTFDQGQLYWAPLEKSAQRLSYGTVILQNPVQIQLPTFSKIGC